MLVVSGEEARKVFFGNKYLDMTEGYKVLFGGVCQQMYYLLTHELTQGSRYQIWMKLI